jgi:hypothetical protein
MGLGDSGGSVFSVRSDGNITARGIISGGGTGSVVGVDVMSSVYSTDIWQVYYGLPGYLRTTPS